MASASRSENPARGDFTEGIISEKVLTFTNHVPIIPSMEATATQTSIQATVFPVLVVTSRSFNVRSRRREGWFAETADKRYSAERTEDDGTPWIVRFGEATLAWTGSLKKAQKIVSNHFLRNAK